MCFEQTIPGTEKIEFTKIRVMSSKNGILILFDIFNDNEPYSELSLRKFLKQECKYHWRMHMFAVVSATVISAFRIANNIALENGHRNSEFSH